MNYRMFTISLVKKYIYIFYILISKLGGDKKKSISKSPSAAGPGDASAKDLKSKTDDSAGKQINRHRSIMPTINEDQLKKNLQSLKAITVYNAAKPLGVSVSISNSILKYLEEKSIISKVGGYSGHYVWKLNE